MDYLKIYREMISLRGLTDHTVKSYSTYIRAYLNYLGNVLHKSPENVSWQELRDYIFWLQRQRSLSDRSINAAISQLRFFTIYVLHMPWDPTQLPLRKFDSYLPFVPSQEDTRHFISTMPDSKQRTMVAVMYSAGLRISGVCHLRYEDIERKNMRIHIRHSKNRQDRYAILSKTALDLLTQYWFACGRPMNWLFPKQNGTDAPIDTFFLSRHIHEHERRLGWPNRLTCHSFRHAFGTHLYENGTGLLTIKALLGHKSLSSTAIYVHLGSHGIHAAQSPLDRMGVLPLADLMIQKIWQCSYGEFNASGHFQSDAQQKASQAILYCKSGKLGCNLSVCPDCGHTEVHNNSCRNRNCPNCQAVQKEFWVDDRRAEVIDSPYFHVVFTLPHELNPLLYCNQALLHGLFHRCCADTLLELSADKQFLGATPGIIQLLHAWNQELLYHVHMHCIISGGGLTRDHRIRLSKEKFFIPVHVLRDKFKGKFLSCLDKLYREGEPSFSSSCDSLRDSHNWKEFRHSLYDKDWRPYIKETFNGFGNAIEYLGRHTHKVAISNSRILSVDDERVAFSARGLSPGEPRRTITLKNTEFIRRYLMHVLPSGFRKIRYYGFLNNRAKTKNLKLIFTLQGHQRFKARYTGLTIAELLKAVWNVNISLCPVCGCSRMHSIGRTYGSP